MIQDALSPCEAKTWIFTARENRGVLNGDAALIVIAIQSPSLKLAARELSFMHQRMKWMFMMVALFPNGMKTGDERGFRKQGRIDGLSLPHIASSIPS